MIYAIILSAGDSQRFISKSSVSKLLIKINKKPIYQYACELFLKCPKIDKIILVLPKKTANSFKFKHKKIIKCFGGKTRNESFKLGVKALKNISTNDYIICHDAARIMTTQKQLDDIIKLIDKKIPFGTLAYKPTDTVFAKDNKKFKLINRKNLLNLQTPQFVTYGLYKKSPKNNNGSDLLSFLHLKPTNLNIIFSDMWNIKITFFNDFKKIIKFFKK